MSKLTQIIDGFRNPATRFLFVLFGLADAIIIAAIIYLVATRNYAGAISAAVTYIVCYLAIRYLVRTGVISFQPTNYERRGKVATEPDIDDEEYES